MPHPFEIGGETVKPGTEKRVEIPVARLPIHTMLHLPVTVVQGIEEGPVLWVSAAIHGDEIIGMEIVRQVLDRVDPKSLFGTLIAVPIVNVFGFINHSRYLPDRRDLNRSFPGSRRGSLASRLAHLFIKEVLSRSSYGIDLHSASPPRINLPQIRANLEDPKTLSVAESFCAPVILHSKASKGTLRAAAEKRGIPALLYEAGEPHRFSADAIHIGVDGILRVMASLKMISGDGIPEGNVPRKFLNSRWIRALQSGIFYLESELGQWVNRKERIGVITDPFGETVKEVRSPANGQVISHTNRPLVHRGDAILHLAVESSESKRFPN